MTCPRCQKELPEDQKGKPCPYCGASPTQIGRRVFLCALLFPGVLTLISAIPPISNMTANVTLGVAWLCSVIGGIICGVTLACQTTNSVPGRIVLSVLFSGFMFIVCMMLCFFGCALSFYNGS